MLLNNRLEELKSMPLGVTGSLSGFIGQLYSNILPMMNHEYTKDALGIFYHEFIKYSSSDGNGLGIVLTPTHLTEFMCEVGDITKNNKVIDICCGSASFLVAAMSKMCSDATSDEINHIKKNSLFGIELDFELYTFAVTKRYDTSPSITSAGRGQVIGHEILLSHFP